MNNINSLPKIYSGKVRDLYAVDPQTMLMVASDRLSTFDVILNQEIPNKGVYLTQIALYWFKHLHNIVPNHVIDSNWRQDLQALLTEGEYKYIRYRSMLVKRLKPLPIEVIVRGYLAGSAYKDYCATGMVSGITLPPNLERAAKLPDAIFTPSTKAHQGAHDESIDYAQCVNLIGEELTAKIKDIALRIYAIASQKVLNYGIILADTKFEFGLDDDGVLTLMDEVLTPDSSRFWDACLYQEGMSPPSLDKQFVRDYLELDLQWNKQPPIPDLPPYVITSTIKRYQEVMRRLKIDFPG